MTYEAFKGEFMVPVSACAEFTVELRVPVSDGLEYLRSIFRVHMNDNMNMYSGVSFILSLRRILPCLKSLPQFCYLKIVCGQNFLCPFINKTALTMPFACCVQYQLILYFNDARSILWAYSAIPGAIWPKGSLANTDRDLVIECVTVTVDWSQHLRWTVTVTVDSDSYSGLVLSFSSVTSR